MHVMVLGRNGAGSRSHYVTGYHGPGYTLPLQPLSETILILRRSEQDITINVLMLFLSYYKETYIFSIDFRKKYSNIKFNGCPSSGSRVVACGRTDRQTDGQIDMTKLIVAFS